MRNNIAILNVYKKKTEKSKIVTQLLYGETFKKITRNGTWIKIKNDADNYKGYVKETFFPSNKKNTHKIFCLKADLYSKPNKKNKIKKKLSFGSEVKVIKKNKIFFKFDNLWIEKKNLKQINYKTKNIFKNLNKFINTKYKWGGKSFNGIDCSGLVQIFFNFNNKFCPRDAKDQIKYFKKKTNIKNIKKNDLIFWKGHVAIVISKKQLIHAYGPLKKVVVMPIKKTVKMIYATANLKVLGIRKIY